MAFVALAVASGGSAGGPKEIDVSLTANGPEPSVVTKAPYDQLEFVNNDSVSHTVVLVRNPHRTCSLDVAPGETTQCHDGGPSWVGKYAYSSDGTFHGTVKVVPYRRSVSLTGGTNTIRAGSELKLHGQLAYDDGSGNCGRTSPLLVRILDRHRPSQPFERIATLRVGGFKHPGTSRGNLVLHTWRLTVRPGLATTYIAETAGAAGFCQQARSRPFVVKVSG